MSTINQSINQSLFNEVRKKEEEQLLLITYHRYAGVNEIIGDTVHKFC